MSVRDENINSPYFEATPGTKKTGTLKIYLGMSAGVGKTYRMLQEAHSLMQENVNVKIAYVETHGRKETQQLIEGLSLIPRRDVFYKGKKLEELDLQAIFLLQPEVVVIDELAHTNIPGSHNEKRWQDVMDVMAAGINVISAVNIQHIESINNEVKKITGIEVKERIPDKVLQIADEVVNIDLTADELITRLKAGKIYDPTKIQKALQNFFQPEKILQLRELALKEAAGQVERKVDYQITAKQTNFRHEHFLACISSNYEMAQRIIRKTSRLASYYNSKWYILYVQSSKESPDKIPLATQRHLINNFKIATEAGAEIIRKKGENIASIIMETVNENDITTICLGKPHLTLFQIILRTSVFNQLLKTLSKNNIDLIILSSNSMRVKRKIWLGSFFMFTLLIATAVVGIIFMAKLKKDAKNILQDNYESLSYAVEMEQSLDTVSFINQKTIRRFDNALTKQEHNITEPGEAQVTANLRKAFAKFINGDTSRLNLRTLRESIQGILSLNMQAIQRKGQNAEKTAGNALTIIITIGGLVFVIGLTFVINFPGIITTPISNLTQAIKEIANKNYKHRIHIDNKDEFGELADAYNEMAERLEYFESSNLNKLMLEKARAEAVINSLRDASIGIDKNDRVLFANKKSAGTFRTNQRRCGRP